MTKCSKALYVETELAGYLELCCRDGTYRGVIFRNATAAADALRSGRAELDCAAVLAGFLPRGATLVSRPGLHPSASAGDASALQEARALASSLPYITAESDSGARKADAAAAAHYDAVADSLADQYQ